MVERVKKQRLLKAELNLDALPEAVLMPFDGSSHTDIHEALPFTREDYFELVDATGRILREGKRRFIASEVPPIIKRLNIAPHKWLEHVKTSVDTMVVVPAGKSAWRIMLRDSKSVGVRALGFLSGLRLD